MSILCDLIEVSDDCLDLLKNYRKARYLYYRTSNTREELKIASISKLSKEQSKIVRELCDGVKDFYSKVTDRNNNIIINIC